VTGRVFTDLAAAQAAVDAWVVDYNTRRPHQALGMATPASRFATRAADPPATSAATTAPLPPQATVAAVQATRRVQANGTIVVGTRELSVGRRLAGTEVVVRAAGRLLQVGQGGVLVKTLPLPAGLDPARLAGGRPAPLAPLAHPGPVRVTRRVHKVGTVTVAGQKFRLGTCWAGQLVTVQVDAALFHVYSDGVLLKTVPRTTRNQVVRFGPTRPPGQRADADQHQPNPPGHPSAQT
jgi:hypothetical protein